MQVGQLLGDPRSTGLSLWLLAAVAILSESYTEALACSEKALGAAVTPYDRLAALASKATALVMLRRIEEALSLFEEHRRLCLSGGFLASLTVTDPFIGICKVLQGNIGAGIRHIEIGILRREAESYQAAADWYRGFLCEVYLQIIAGREKLTIFKVLKNLPVLLKVFFIAPSRIAALTAEIMKNPQFDSSGSHVGRTQMALGLLYKIKKKRALALQHLNEARRIFSQFGQTPILGRVETALAELGQ
jgi:tetratricopeptide (TPR) repeat protein